jgi:hypothetical protein
MRKKASNSLTENDSGGGLPIATGFLWVLRDFALRLVDENGNKLSDSEYLEMALSKKNSKTENKGQVRDLFK